MKRYLLDKEDVVWIYKGILCCGGFSVTKLCPTLWPQGLQHARLPCPPLPLGVCSNSCPLSWWCYLIMSSSATPFSFRLQSFPISGSFALSQPFASRGQSLELQLQCQFFHWIFRIDLQLTAFFSLHFKGFSSLLQQHNSKESILWHPAFFMVQLSHLCVTTRKTITLTIWTFVSKEMFLFLIRWLGLS